MFILKSFPKNTDAIKLKHSVLANTNPLIKSSYYSSGIYSKIGENTITILSVEKNDSLRGENFNILFYGIIISWFSKSFLLGWIGPSIIYTTLTFLIVLFPFEYIEFRIVALVVWMVVYLGNSNRIKKLRNFILNTFLD